MSDHKIHTPNMDAFTEFVMHLFDVAKNRDTYMPDKIVGHALSWDPSYNLKDAVQAMLNAVDEHIAAGIKVQAIPVDGGDYIQLFPVEVDQCQQARREQRAACMDYNILATTNLACDTFITYFGVLWCEAYGGQKKRGTVTTSITNALPEKLRNKILRHGTVRQTIDEFDRDTLSTYEI